MPLNEHFTCKNMIVKIFRTPKILEDHKNSWNSSKLWNLPKNADFYITNLIVFYAREWENYL